MRMWSGLPARQAECSPPGALAAVGLVVVDLAAHLHFVIDDLVTLVGLGAVVVLVVVVELGQGVRAVAVADRVRLLALGPLGRLELRVACTSVTTSRSAMPIARSSCASDPRITRRCPTQGAAWTFQSSPTL